MGFIEKHRRKILIIITCIIVVIIFITSAYYGRATFIGDALGYVVTPIQKGLGRVSSYVDEKVNFWTRAAEFEEQNKLLETRLEELETENNRLKLYEIENKKLNQLLNLKEKYNNYPTIGAEVIAKDPGNWYETFSIDKGNKDGLSKDMVVLAQSGLVGRITETGAKFSKVISIIDDRSSVPAKNKRTDDVGIVKGDSKLREDGLCKMTDIEASAEIIVGDEIITSQLSEIYPPGITIGRIKEITTNENGLTKDALIEPVVDFKHIETVLVMNGKEDYFMEE